MVGAGGQGQAAATNARVHRDFGTAGPSSHRTDRRTTSTGAPPRSEQGCGWREDETEQVSGSAHLSSVRARPLYRVRRHGPGSRRTVHDWKTQFPLGAVLSAFAAAQDEDGDPLAVMLVICGLPPRIANIHRPRSKAERVFKVGH